MARKLKHKTVVSTLRDIITEGEHNASSGDIRLASSGRHSALLGTILLQLVSAFPEEEFNSVNLANYTKKDVVEEVAAEAEEEETEETDKEEK